MISSWFQRESALAGGKPDLHQDGAGSFNWRKKMKSYSGMISVIYNVVNILFVYMHGF
jgi:hypothetical protein